MLYKTYLICFTYQGFVIANCLLCYDNPALLLKGVELSKVIRDCQVCYHSVTGCPEMKHVKLRILCMGFFCRNQILCKLMNTGTSPLTRFFGPGKTMLKENRVIGGVFQRVTNNYLDWAKYQNRHSSKRRAHNSSPHK